MMGRVSGVPYQVELPGIFTGSTLRPATDQMFMSIALVASTRATCVRRRVGCVLVNNKNHILSLGYNGQPSGFEHCIDNPCGGSCNASGEGLDECEAIHAEANAITRLKEPDNVHTCYVTTAPCVSCLKLLLATSCQRIVYLHDYPQGGNFDLWAKAGRLWEHYDPLDYKFNMVEVMK